MHLVPVEPGTRPVALNIAVPEAAPPPSSSVSTRLPAVLPLAGRARPCVRLGRPIGRRGGDRRIPAHLRPAHYVVSTNVLSDSAPQTSRPAVSEGTWTGLVRLVESPRPSCP